eukprot:4296769-Pyramimonas_sp.AAC.1
MTQIGAVRRSPPRGPSKAPCILMLPTWPERKTPIQKQPASERNWRVQLSESEKPRNSRCYDVEKGKQAPR